jgi:hypothetical protein
MAKPDFAGREILRPRLIWKHAKNVVANKSNMPVGWARGEEQKSGVIIDKRELRPIVAGLDYPDDCASPIGRVSEVPI